MPPSLTAVDKYPSPAPDPGFSCDATPPVSPKTFMSISPIEIQGSGSSSSSLNLQANPSSDHGSRGVRDRDPLDRQIGRISLGGAADGWAPATSAGSESASDAGAVDRPGLEGLAVAVSRDSCDLPENVAEFTSPDSSDQSSDPFSQCHTAVQEGISSYFRPEEFGHQKNGNGNDRFLHSNNLAAGSIGFQGSATHSASRRNQAVNANHLLNFQFDPISHPPPRVPPPRRQRKIKPYNKDLFLQANYKFVVLDTGSNLVESMDPDKMLQWEDVVCVRYSTPFPVQCPICLESPLCAQITSCGHIYCFPCILQYLLMGKEDHRGDSWKKCPICSMMLSSKDLYTIHIDNVKQFHVGDRAYFTLLNRPKDSLFPTLKNQEAGIMPCDSGGISNTFSKFSFTSDVEVSIAEAKSGLNNWLRNAESGFVDDLERLPYVCAALAQLEERLKNWVEHQNFNGSPLRNRVPPSSYKARNASSMVESNSLDSVSDANIVKEDACISVARTPYASQNHETAELLDNMVCESSPDSVVEFSETSDKLIPSDKNSSSKDAGERDSYSFYQAVDGQHLILHPFNVKCLLHHYGSYNMLPPRICGPILEMETVTQSEAIRRRYRYLSHFSLTTTFQLCEIDLSEILPPSSLAPFMDEIKKRERQRKRLARKEQEDKVRAEAAAAVDMMHIPFGHRHSHQTDETFSSDDFAVLGNAVVPSTSPPSNNERKLFSDVTRLGFAAAHDSPSLKPESSANPSGLVEKIKESPNSQGPVTALSFAEIMSSAKTAVSPVTQNSSGLGKKGKKPTRVLLSTAGGRRY